MGLFFNNYLRNRMTYMKLDKFKGRIDFKKDSKAKIDRTLKQLSDYLNSYNEDEASKIIDEFVPASGPSDNKEYVNELKMHSKLMGTISYNLKKIREDLIDEQENKLKLGKAEWKNKGKDIIKTEKPLSPEAKKMQSNPLDWLKKNLLGNLLGSLLPKLLKSLLSPIKWILAGLFAAGKLGAKLIMKGVKSVIIAGLKAGGWIFKKVKGAFASLWSKYATPRLDAMTNKIKDLGASILNKGKNVLNKGKDLVKNKIKGIGEFFKKAGSRLGINDLATKGMTKVKSAAGKAKNLIKPAKIPKALKKVWDVLKKKVMSIGTKLGSALSRSPGAGKVLAKNLPKALGKFASKFIPGVGWALLAYAVYSAHKKSSGAVSFAVNLIDEVTGGLLGLGIQAGSDFNGDNLGEYVSNLVQGFSFGEDLDINMDAFNLSDDPLPSKASFTDPKKELEAIKSSSESPAVKQASINEYNKLQELVQNGSITNIEASKRFKTFVLSTSKKGDSFSSNNSINTQNSVEQIKVQDVNISSMDISSATTVHTSLLTMEASMNLAAKTAAMVANSISGSAVNSMQSFLSPSPAREQGVMVQG